MEVRNGIIQKCAFRKLTDVRHPNVRLLLPAFRLPTSYVGIWYTNAKQSHTCNIMASAEMQYKIYKFDKFAI